MKNWNFKMIVKSKENEYGLSDRFNLEKKFDYARYYTIFSKFYNKYDSINKHTLKTYNLYTKSFLNELKKNVKSGSLSNEDALLVKENSVLVKIKIYIENKTFILNELKLTDNLINYLQTKQALEKLHEDLQKKFEKSNLGLSIKTIFSSKDKLSKTYLQANKKVIKFLKEVEMNEKNLEKVNKWIDFASQAKPKHKNVNKFLEEFEAEDVENTAE